MRTLRPRFALLLAGGFAAPVLAQTVTPTDILVFGIQRSDSRLDRALDHVRTAPGDARGWNAAGQCNVPALPTNTTHMAIAASAQHSYARGTDGTVVAFGETGHGQRTVPPCRACSAAANPARRWR